MDECGWTVTQEAKSSLAQPQLVPGRQSRLLPAVQAVREARTASLLPAVHTLRDAAARGM